MTTKILRRSLAVILLATATLAQQDSAELARRKAEQASAELQQRADRASGGECVKLSMRAAHQALQDADYLFSAGSMQPAHAAVDLALHDAKRAVECTLESRKHLKSAEIELRSLIRRMNELVRTLDTEERPQLTEAIAELEKERDRLLQAIFGAQAAGPREQGR
jgi:1-aminocyclopropane-1-carboxylate deaminase/D-cysteine desulfhydrase-like pyridoxal-dependent ACC family enzyme